MGKCILITLLTIFILLAIKISCMHLSISCKLLRINRRKDFFLEKKKSIYKSKLLSLICLLGRQSKEVIETIFMEFMRS
jgi:hypothetical protein